METKKLSKTVRRRLNKQKRLQSGASVDTNLPKTLPTTATTPKIQSKPKKKKVDKTTLKTHSSTETKALLKVASEVEVENSTTSMRNRKRKRNPESKVVYINSNYGSNDGVGGLIQAGLLELRNESKNIKTASDLTESQAHIVKRQITRLQGPEKERVFRRPKHYNKTLGEATKELALLMEKQKAKHVAK